MRVCGGKDQEAPMVNKGKLLFQSYSGGEPFPDLDYYEIRQLVADGGKDEVSGWHFLSTLAASQDRSLELCAVATECTELGNCCFVHVLPFGASAWLVSGLMFLFVGRTYI